MSLRDDLIKLAYHKPELREDVLPLVTANSEYVEPVFVDVSERGGKGEMAVGFEIDRNASLVQFSEIAQKPFLDEFARQVRSSFERGLTLKETSRTYIGRGVVKCEGVFKYRNISKTSQVTSLFSSAIEQAAPKAVITFESQE